jgi:hypothetical protein
LSVQRTFFGGSKHVLLSFEAKSALVLKRTLSPKDQKLVLSASCCSLQLTALFWLTADPVCKEQGEAGKLLIDCSKNVG